MNFKNLAAPYFESIIDELKYQATSFVEDVIDRVTEDVKSAAMDADPVNNDPVEVTLHLTREQGQLLYELANSTGGSPFSSRRGLMDDIRHQLLNQGYEGVSYPKDIEFHTFGIVYKDADDTSSS